MLNAMNATYISFHQIFFFIIIALDMQQVGTYSEHVWKLQYYHFINHNSFVTLRIMKRLADLQG